MLNIYKIVNIVVYVYRKKLTIHYHFSKHSSMEVTSRGGVDIYREFSELFSLTQSLRIVRAVM